MERLTEKDVCGNWRLKGLPWKNLYEGTPITRETYEVLYGALCKLLAYEETGLTPEEIEMRTYCTMGTPCEFQSSKIRKDGWIPVEERMPEDGTYLCTFTGDLVGQEEPFTGMCGIENGIWDEPDCVIAWQPLPEMQEAFQDTPKEQWPLAIEKTQILTAALQLLAEQERKQQEELESLGKAQTELPLMKNNDQRKEWLRNYQAWGLWYEDERIGVRYYKYEFDNGAQLIAEEYPAAGKRDFTASYLHLVGGPEPPKHPSYGCPRWSRHARYDKHPDSETELVEFLKAVQR